MKILAVGDIHTKIWIIDLVESVIDNYDAVVFCGDYADDWGASSTSTIATWKRLKELQDKHGDSVVHLVKGNHDYIYVNKTPSLQSGYNIDTQALIDEPKNKKLKDWLISIPELQEVDGVSYSHAGVTDEWLETNVDNDILDFWRDNSPIWVRPGYGIKYKNTPQVFGHTPSKTCWEVQENIWCIDTFSTYQDGSPIGDCSMLEVTDGKKFKKIKINANNSNSTSFEGGILR